MLVFLLFAAAATFSLHENGRDVDFSYSWPGEASAIPSLRAHLRGQLQHDRLRTAKNAGEDRKLADGDYIFRQHEFSRAIEYAGQSRRLASFEDNVGNFTGGAHPNSWTKALLWDKARRKGIEFRSLFTRSPTPLLRSAYCKGLAAERKRKLGDEEVSPDIWELCPDPLTLAVVPADRDHDGRFDHLVITASPYAVGSYVEGEYVITLRVTRSLLAALKPEFRASFEA